MKVALDEEILRDLSTKCNTDFVFRLEQTNYKNTLRKEKSLNPGCVLDDIRELFIFLGVTVIGHLLK